MPDKSVQQKNVTPDRTENDRWMFGHLRSISSACQNFQGCIASALQESASMPTALRTASIAGVLNSALLDAIESRIASELKAIEKLFVIDVLEFEWASAEVTSIELNWTHAKASFASAAAATDNQEQKFKDIENDLDRIVYSCMSLTLSPGINDVMKNLRVGQPLDVEFEFGEEFPKSAELRKRLLLKIAQEAVVIDGGVVDAEQGVIYKASPSRSGQLASSWRLTAVLLLGFLLPFALAFGGKVLPDWPFASKDLHSLLANFALILLGSGAHLAIAALNAGRAQSHPSFQALNDWVLWVHVREAQIFKGILSIWAGFALLSFGIHGLSWSSAFFAGYSIDSVTEVFLGRFENTVVAKTRLLTQTAE
jgi:hypothetical protein